MSNRNRIRAGVVAGLFGAALVLPMGGSAMAGAPEDEISMACSAVKDSSDPSAAAALRLYGFQPEAVKGKVGFFCLPTEDPEKANFCAVANQKDAFLAIGKDGACAGASQAPMPAQPNEPTEPTEPAEPADPAQPVAPPALPPIQPPIQPPAEGAPTTPPPPPEALSPLAGR